MTSKAAVVVEVMSILALAGCGSNESATPISPSTSAPSASMTQAVNSTTVSVPKGDVSPLDSGLLAKAQWVGKETGCQLDSVDGNTSADTLKLSSSKLHVFRGWLLDKDKLPPGKFSLVFKGAQDYAIAATTGELRKDVGEYFKQPTASTAGFSVSADLSTVPAGNYVLTFLMQEKGGVFFCDTGRKVSIE